MTPRVGDKIRAIHTEPGQYIRKGKVYTVKEITSSGGALFVQIAEINRPHGYHLFRFELASRIRRSL